MDFCHRCTAWRCISSRLWDHPVKAAARIYTVLQCCLPRTPGTRLSVQAPDQCMLCQVWLPCVSPGLFSKQVKAHKAGKSRPCVTAQSHTTLSNACPKVLISAQISRISRESCRAHALRLSASDTIPEAVLSQHPAFQSSCSQLTCRHKECALA
jgi:hypothetical protein